MKTLPHDTLPLATTPAFTPAGRQHRGGGQDWLRAMAQAAVAPREPAWQRTSGDARPTPAADAQVVVAQLPWRMEGPSAVCGQAMPGNASVAMQAPRQTFESASVRGEAGPTPVPERTAHATPEEDVQSVKERAPARGQRNLRPVADAPLRVHVELQDGGMALWLGVDRNVTASSVQLLVRELRATARAGLPLFSVVCNGATVFGRSPPGKDTP